MFRVEPIGFGGPVNGFQTMVMQSQEDTDKVIDAFEEAIAAGYNPNDIKDEVFRKCGVDESDLLDYDKNRLVTKVEELYRMYQYSGKRNF